MLCALLYYVASGNVLFAIRCKVFVYEQCKFLHDSLKTYITAVGRCFRLRTLNPFVTVSVMPIEPFNITLFWSHIQVC